MRNSRGPAEVRQQLSFDPRQTVLFLTNWGEPITDHNMTSGMARYVRSAQIGKSGSCHIFRHTMATLMLENGADVRFIQAMLGHAELTSTEIYTHVSIRKLKQIHTETHPGANLKGEASRENPQSQSGTTGTEAEAPAKPLDPAEQQVRQEVLAAAYSSGAHIAKPPGLPPGPGRNPNVRPLDLPE